MTPEELAEQVKQEILVDEMGELQLGTFAKPGHWARQYSDATGDLAEATGKILIEQGVLKPDNRKHSGLGANRGDRYRISRGWWNRNHKGK